VGVSFSGPDINLRWVEEEQFQFEVWDDTDKTLAITYGAAASRATAIPKRVTRVLDAEGNLVLEYNDVDTGTSPQRVLEDCQILFGR
jgi:peroxiredoxin